MQVTGIIRRPFLLGIAISASLVVAWAAFPETVSPLIVVAVVVLLAAVLLLSPMLGPFAIWKFLRWINRRDDPRYSIFSDSQGKSSGSRRYLGWCGRILWFGLGAAFPYAGWSVYRSVSEPPLLRVHSRLMTLLIEGDFDQAYRLTTDKYQARKSAREFEAAFRYMKGDEYYVPRHATVISFGVRSAEVYGFDDPGFFELLNGPVFFYIKEYGEWRFTGRKELYLD
jgi:hypothetical protein